MEYTKKLIYQSNYWYNDGLAKAKIHDLSGATVSLRKSLQYNRGNVAARNLLGLVCYAKGEIAEALVEWIISKNFKNHENIADYYIKKVQESAGELDTINNAIKKYNQCLTYCLQDGEDLALIQLKKVVAAHPTFLKALQLLALLYLQTEQYAKAKQILKRAHRIDTTNETTLRYLHELSRISKKIAKAKEENEQTVTYNLGNETIIQPAAEVKDNGAMATIINILIGIVVGAAVVWFLIVPSTNQMKTNKLNKEIVKYSDQISGKNAEISALKKEIEGYKDTNKKTEEAQATAEATKTSYEALLGVYDHSKSSGYSKESLAKELKAVKKEALGDTGIAVYDKIYDEYVSPLCAKKYRLALRNYEVKNYATSVTALEFVTSIDEKYEGGKALLNLAKSYEKAGKTEQAKTTYKRVSELYPNTELASQAQQALTGTATSGENNTEAEE
ncbi:tetratricopeptide repeat protein [Faecalimonas sp.]